LLSTVSRPTRWRNGPAARPTRLLVRTSDGSAPPPVTGPAAPSGLRAVVYSSTAGAIAWDRAETGGLRHQIARDGEVVGTTDGVTFVDVNLRGGRGYAYEVVAIDRAGRRSAASTVTLTTAGGNAPPPDDPFATPDPTGSTALARLGYRGARDLADDLVSAAYLDLYYDIDAMVPPLLANADGSESVDRVVDCPGGGTARGSGNGFAYALLAFDGCVLGDRTLTGRLERTANRFPVATGGVRELSLDFGALRIDAGAAGTLTLTGSVERGAGRGASAPCDAYESASDTIRIDSARLERGADLSTITDATYRQSTSRRNFGQTPPCSTIRGLRLEGTASVVSTRFGGQRATISIRGVVGNDSDDVDGVGLPLLEADFGDGSRLAVTATSDSNDRAQVDLASDGAAVSFFDEYAFEPHPYAATLY